jgi:acyl dehydratase
MRQIASIDDLAPLLGQRFAESDWLVVDQPRITAFAEATEDRQWIHIDPARAAQGPFGTTIGHGFLTLSLVSHFVETGFSVGGVRMALNYGLNRVRFPAPVPVGSRLRAGFTMKAVEPIEGGVQLTVEVVVEREGSDKPVCVAESLLRLFR